MGREKALTVENRSVDGEIARIVDKISQVVEYTNKYMERFGRKISTRFLYEQ